MDGPRMEMDKNFQDQQGPRIKQVEKKEEMDSQVKKVESKDEHQGPENMGTEDKPFPCGAEDQHRLTVLTWNLDGLDLVEPLRRAFGLFSIIKKYQPDIILLQELINPYLRILKKNFENYDFLQGSELFYFTGIMMRRSRVQLLQSSVVKYPGTKMGRNLLVANVSFFGQELCVMTSHLESCKTGSGERLNQLRRVWKRMRATPDNIPVIFGGDTNLRDWELGSLPEGISDVWEDLGKPMDCKYTWDTVLNDNKEIQRSVQHRFDRVFRRAAQDGAQVVPESMTLVGLKRLKCGRFISDHWGIFCTFAVKPQNTKEESSSSCSSPHMKKPVERDIDVRLTFKQTRAEVKKHVQGDCRDAIKRVDEEMLNEVKKLDKSKVQKSPKDAPYHKDETSKPLQRQPPHGPTPPQVSSKGQVVQGASSEDLTFQDELFQDISPESPVHHAEFLQDQPLQREEAMKDQDKLTVLTWNTDGLDIKDFRKRCDGLTSNIRKYRPDVILLQELVSPYLTVLKKQFEDYDFVQGSEVDYFTGIMLKKCRVQLLQSNIVKFPTTEMGRNLLMTNVSFFRQELCVMTSHLESCRAGSQERLNQLRRVWKRMREAPDNITVIFGGDTNLRDWEVDKLGGLPAGISDIWEDLGKPEDSRYTWDPTVNNNKDIDYDVRLRFDRIFLRAPREGAQVVPVSMTLIGLDRLRCGRFVSDHWGIFCTFTFKSQ